MTEQNSENPKGKRPRRLGRGLAGLIPTGTRLGKDDPQAEKSQPAQTDPLPASVDGSGINGGREGLDAPSRSDLKTASEESMSVRTPGARPPVEVEVTVPGGPQALSEQGRDGTSDPQGDRKDPGVPRGTSGSTGQTDDAGTFELLEIDAIQTNPHQPREYFDQEAIEELSRSIRSSGLIQPITVRRKGDHLELVAGERRLRASKLAGLTRIPAIVRTLTDRDCAEWALVENLQREDLNPLERAKGLRRLIDEFSLTHQQAAEAVGLERASVSNLLRLLDLDPTTSALVARGALGLGQAKVLLAVQDVQLRGELCRTASQREWSVRRLETEVRRLLAPEPSPASPPLARSARTRTQQVDQLERELSEHLGTRVEISLGRREGQGRLMVNFHSLEHFDDLMERIGFSSGSE